MGKDPKGTASTKNGFYYTKEHEWVTVEENTVTLGVTDYAQQSLGDIVFIDLPEPGTRT